MTVNVDWAHFTQQKLRLQLDTWFEKKGVTTYEEASAALRSAGLSVGSPEEVAPFLPAPSDTDTSNTDSGASSSSSSARRTQEILSSSKKKEPKSAAEAAADAITKSKAVKSPKSTQKKRSTRKRKST